MLLVVVVVVTAARIRDWPQGSNIVDARKLYKFAVPIISQR